MYATRRGVYKDLVPAMADETKHGWGRSKGRNVEDMRTGGGRGGPLKAPQYKRELASLLNGSGVNYPAGTPRDGTSRKR